MREFAKFSPQFWMGPLSKKIKHCNFEAKTLAFYLMTCPSSNMIGFYYLPLSLMAHEIGTTLEVVSKGIAMLIQVGFCAYDEETDYVWVYEMALTQVGSALKPKDNKVKHVNELFQALPDVPFISNFYEKYRDILHLSPSKLLAIPLEASKKKEVRSEKREVISNKEDLPIIFCGEQKEVTQTETQKPASDEEEKRKNIIPLVKKMDSIVFTVPLRQGKTRSISEDELVDWQKNYPAIDVRQEIRQLIAWNQANPDRQKTQRGINRHIQGWLAHTQQNKPPSTRDSFSSSLSTWDHNMAVMQAVLEEDDEIE